MPRLSALAVLTLLAACGADGPPVAPSQAAVKPGVTVTGTVEAGVVVKN